MINNEPSQSEQGTGMNRDATEQAISRRTYLKLGSTAGISLTGFIGSGAAEKPQGLPNSNGHKIGYGERGYGEHGYGGV